MNRNKTFINFLESLKGHEHDTLIESIKMGFDVCFESTFYSANDVDHFMEEMKNEKYKDLGANEVESIVKQRFPDIYLNEVVSPEQHDVTDYIQFSDYYLVSSINLILGDVNAKELAIVPKSDFDYMLSKPEHVMSTI